MSKKPDLTKGGIITNLDDPLSEKQKQESHEQDRQIGIIEDAKKEARARGGDTFGIYTDEETRDGKTEIHKLKQYEKELENDIRHLPRLKASIRLDPSAPEGFQWILNDAEVDAIAAGYFCPNCLMAQEEQQTGLCKWRDRPADGDVPGCGYHRGFDRNVGTEAYK